MDKVRRVLVYVWKERGAPQQAPFLQVRTFLQSPPGASVFVFNQTHWGGGGPYISPEQLTFKLFLEDGLCGQRMFVDGASDYGIKTKPVQADVHEKDD